MARLSDPDLLVLLGLRLHPVITAEALVPFVHRPCDEVSERLARFGSLGWADHRDGILTGWTLLPAGRIEVERRVLDERDSRGARDAIDEAYRRFLPLNATLLQVCTDWQLRSVEDGAAPVVNDHTDTVHDDAVVEVLRGIDAAVQPICADLTAALERFSAYGPRLRSALGHIEAGDGDWFTRPTVDSYHTVWFELHENLLTTLAIERGAEVLR